MNDEFPECVGEPENEMPPQLAAIVSCMFGDGERPDTRELEWRNVMMLVSDAASMDNARMHIERALNVGYGLNQLFKIKDGIVYWQGARLRKPEGE